MTNLEKIKFAVLDERYRDFYNPLDANIEITKWVKSVINALEKCGFEIPDLNREAE